jgi:hypothetical protein
MKDRFSAIINRIASSSLVSYVMSSRPVVLFLRFRSFLQSSVLGFSIFVLLSTICLSVIRLFYVWLLNAWDHIGVFYYVTIISFCCSLFIILLNYLNKNGWFDRIIENRQKWASFEQSVADSNKLVFHLRFRKFGSYFIFLAILITSVTGSQLVFSFFTIFLAAYFVNSLYIHYFVFVTPVPVNLQLRPSKLYQKVFDKYLFNRFFARRYYSSRVGAMILTTETRKVARAAGLAAAAATAGYFALDVSTAALKGEASTVLQHMDEAEYGASTRHMDTRRKAIFLMENCNLEAKDLSTDGRFDDMKVNHEYQRVEESKFLTPKQLGESTNKEIELEQRLIEREAELTELRSRLESLESTKAKSNLEELDIVEGKEGSSV